MLRLVIAAILAVDAVLHFQGAMLAWAPFKTDWALQNSWVFSAGVTLRSPAGRALGLLFVAAMALLLLGAYGLGTQREWFRPALMAGAAVSAVAILPWFRVIPEALRF